MKIIAHELPHSYWRRVAERHGIPAHTWRMRLRRGWDQQRAATTPLMHASNRQPDPASRTQKLKAAGLRTGAIGEYRRENPDTRLSDDEIIARLLERRNRNTLTDRARAAGLNPATVYKRVRRMGWSEERALSTPIMTRREAGQIRARQRWHYPEARA